MKKFYTLLLFCLLFVNVASASNQLKAFSKSYYEKMKGSITDETIIKASILYKKNINDVNAFHVCIGCYVCGDDEIREMLEEELGSIGNVIDVAKRVIQTK